MPAGAAQDDARGDRGHICGAADNLRRLRSAGGSDGQERTDAFWALRDVSFEVTPGEVVGHHRPQRRRQEHAAEDPLPDHASRPTGERWIRGRVGSLLEVGTGFHPELTGRENIYLNGAILGMTRREIARKFDEIVAFAEVERFLDTPVKHYSSGMYVRLAFAVAAHLEPEILLVDEVLAVGDAEFQKKCLGKMGEVAQRGAHRAVREPQSQRHPAAVPALGAPPRRPSGGGRVHRGGVRQYLAQAPDAPGPRQLVDLSLAQRTGTQEVLIQRVEYSSDDAGIGYEPFPDGPLELKLDLVSNRPRTIGSLGMNLHDQKGASLISVDTMSLGSLRSNRAATLYAADRGPPS